MNNKKYKYNENSFGDRLESLRSAKVIVPIVLDFVQPKSVVDVGCGTGEFLSVFMERGIEDVFGIDGPWINKEKLRIPKNCFLDADLEKPLKLNRKFDLVISLEVAEHLSKNSAEVFVETLTNLGPIVLFSAAIPFQEGSHHINEQWPEYWVELFSKKGYVPIDCIRKKIWNNKDVNLWYAQNTIFFVKKDYLETNEKLKKEFEQTEPYALAIVHPNLYLPRAERLELIVRITRFIPKPVKRVIKKCMTLFK